MLSRFVPLYVPGAYLYPFAKKYLNLVYEHLNQKSNLTGLYDR
jgi:hypothetical protein